MPMSTRWLRFVLFLSLYSIHMKVVDGFGERMGNAAGSDHHPRGTNNNRHHRKAKRKGREQDDNHNIFGEKLEEIDTQMHRKYFNPAWLRGVKQGATVVGGVRSSSFVSLRHLPRGGDSESTTSRGAATAATAVAVSTGLVTLDRMVRSFVIFSAWFVSLQAWGTALRTHSEPLLEFASRFIGHETITALRTIRKMLASVEDDHGVIDIFSRYAAPDIIASIHALSRLQAACHEYDLAELEKRRQRQKEMRQSNNGKEAHVDNDDESSPSSSSSLLLLNDLVRYVPYASAAYGWTLDLATAGRLHRGDLRALVKMTQISDDDVVMVNWEAETNRPAFYIARDREKKRIVLAIRGTWSAGDVLTDLCCTTESYQVSGREYCAHHGMLAAARGVADVAEDIITKEFRDHPDYTLTLVGHSLGGSVAAILGNFWDKKFPDVTVFAYGAACVVPLKEQSKCKVYSVMNQGDPFSSLSLGHVADVSAALAHLCENPELRATILMRTDGAADQLELRDQLWCVEIRKKIEEKMVGEKLYPPGKLFYLWNPNTTPSTRRKGGSTGSTGVAVTEVERTFFNDLRLGPRMFDLSRHVPRLYEARLREYRRTHHGNNVVGVP